MALVAGLPCMGHDPDNDAGDPQYRSLDVVIADYQMPSYRVDGDEVIVDVWRDLVELRKVAALERIATALERRRPL